MYSATQIATYVVNKCVKDDVCISNLQLQKILYYIQKSYLKKNSQAFSDEIEAWKYGPVVPNAYYKFSVFGGMPITLESPVDFQIAPEDAQIIDQIVAEKRKLDPWDMVADTHQSNGAWDRVYKNGDGVGEKIPLDFIREE